MGNGNDIAAIGKLGLYGVLALLAIVAFGAISSSFGNTSTVPGPGTVGQGWLDGLQWGSAALDPSEILPALYNTFVSGSSDGS